MAVTYWNENVRQEMYSICSDEGVGINSFKMFMAYKVKNESWSNTRATIENGLALFRKLSKFERCCLILD